MLKNHFISKLNLKIRDFKVMLISIILLLNKQKSKQIQCILIHKCDTLSFFSQYFHMNRNSLFCQISAASVLLQFHNLPEIHQVFLKMLILFFRAESKCKQHSASARALNWTSEVESIALHSESIRLKGFQYALTSYQSFLILNNHV